MSNAQPQPPGRSKAQHLAPIEIGLVIIGRIDRIDRRAISATREQLASELNQTFARFDWRITIVQREEVPLSIRQEPSALLRDGSDLREAEGWDFALLFTAADLTSRYKPYALAATSSALDLAIISTNRIDPHSFDANIEDHERIAVLTGRLTTLCIRSLGHLNGLGAAAEPHNIMHIPSSPEAIAAMTELDDAQRDAMDNNLQQIADPRLEETRASEFSSLQFYFHSARINRHEIANAVVHSRPWEFPFRLLRLTASAVSATSLLMLTAEAWHLASMQPIGKLVLLLMLVLVATTVFVAKRQGLLIPKRHGFISEQVVITNLAAYLIVLLGLATTAVVLLIMNALAGFLLYSPSLIAVWVATDTQAVGMTHYAQVALLVTTLGLLIGSLGATFEDQHHFRHVVFVDEEI